MRATRTRTLVLLAAGVAAVTWVVLRWWASSGHELPMLPWSTPGVMALLAVAVLVVAFFVATVAFRSARNSSPVSVTPA